MNKKQKLLPVRANQGNGQVVPVPPVDRKEDPKPKPRAANAMAKPCSLCTALREPGTNYSRVYSKQGNTRYCRCDFCNNTWKQIGEE